MKAKNKIFFGEKGLTSTKANHLCQVSKGVVARLEEKLNGSKFVDKDVSLIGSETRHPAGRGIKSSELSEIPQILTEIAACNSFNAWMREAISAKKEELDEIKSLSFAEYCEDILKVSCPREPALPLQMQYDEALATLDVATRQQYLMLEAVTSTIGKAIHPNRPFDLARTSLLSKVANPIETKVNGKDTIFCYYSPSVPVEEVENMYFNLQGIHREHEARLNSIKFNLTDLMTAENTKRNLEYREAYANYKNEFNELYSQYKEYVNVGIEAVSALKIIVPNALQSTLDKLESLQKKK